MASTNQTTNYGLSQYIGSDKPTYLGDYNSDMLKIDTQMKANATAVATAQNTADTVNITANSALSKATTNESDISFLKTINNITISNIETGVALTYDFEQMGSLYMLDITIGVTGVSNTWKKLATINIDYLPSVVLNSATIINSNTSGNIIGYGMVEINTSGELRIRTQSTHNENIYARCLFTWIHEPTV